MLRNSCLTARVREVSRARRTETTVETICEKSFLVASLEVVTRAVGYVEARGGNCFLAIGPVKKCHRRNDA